MRSHSNMQATDNTCFVLEIFQIWVDYLHASKDGSYDLLIDSNHDSRDMPIDFVEKSTYSKSNTHA